MQKKTKRIKFWLNDEELAELEQKAKKANMNRSEYMRHLIDSCQIVHAPEIDYDRYLTEFKALGDELDRYLITLNTTGIFDEKKFDDVCGRTLTLMKELEAEISEKLRIEIEKAKGESECETESTISKCD